MNSFDAAVYLLTLVAVIMGFNSGLLRSLATIFGYVAATAIAVVAAPRLTPILAAQFKIPQGQDWLVPAGVFLVSGFLLSALLRFAIGEMVGPNIGIADRMAGAFFGAVRIVLLAVLMVLIFDRIIPADHQPAFLADSRLRPILSMAGQQGLRSLPPDVADTIDRLKREHGI
jgi:membrane protein required for colicin V production